MSVENAPDVTLPHEEDPAELAGLARACSANATWSRLRAFALFEEFPLSGAQLDEVDRLLDLAAAEDRREGESLRRLNAFFLAVGHPVGNEVVIRGRVYRTANNGHAAVDLGAEMPADDAWSDRDELAGRTAEYAQMVHVP